jgi:hypothetical protein
MQSTRSGTDSTQRCGLCQRPPPEGLGAPSATSTQSTKAPSGTPPDGGRWYTTTPAIPPLPPPPPSPPIAAGHGQAPGGRVKAWASGPPLSSAQPAAGPAIRVAMMAMGSRPWLPSPPASEEVGDGGGGGGSSSAGRVLRPSRSRRARARWPSVLWRAAGGGRPLR